MKIVKIVVLVVLAAMTIGTVQQVFFGNKEASVESSEYLCQRGYLHSKDFVTEALRAPATAKFPDQPTSAIESDADSLGRRIINISSYVDAQNVYGALVRTNFTCKLAYSSHKWRLLDLQHESQ